MQRAVFLNICTIAGQSTKSKTHTRTVNQSHNLLFPKLSIKDLNCNWKILSNIFMGILNHETIFIQTIKTQKFYNTKIFRSRVDEMQQVHCAKGVA